MQDIVPILHLSQFLVSKLCSAYLERDILPFDETMLQFFSSIQCLDRIFRSNHVCVILLITLVVLILADEANRAQVPHIVNIGVLFIALFTSLLCTF